MVYVMVERVHSIYI